MIPFITLSGADSAAPFKELSDLNAEIGILYTFDPAGRPRYPSRQWCVWLGSFCSKVALHICGTRSRKQLMCNELEDLVWRAQRIQVNGYISTREVESICALYPEHTIITQHHEANEHLLEVRALNHAILVDASGGQGKKPKEWTRPETIKPVGFAGGLGPDNLATELPKIRAIAGDADWWVDMENNLRTDDRFDIDKANMAVEAFYAQVT